MPRLRRSGVYAVLAFVPLLSACGTYTGAGAGVSAEVTCRDVLEPPSNVMRNRCMTGREWADYERNREDGAQEFMRQMLDRPAYMPQ